MYLLTIQLLLLSRILKITIDDCVGWKFYDKCAYKLFSQGFSIGRNLILKVLNRWT